MCLFYALAIPLLDIDPKAMSVYNQEKNHARMYVAVLFKIAKTRGKCRSTEEWVIHGIDTQWNIT